MLVSRRFFTVDLEKNIDTTALVIDSELASFVQELAFSLQCGTGDIFIDFGNRPDSLTGLRGQIRSSLVRIIPCNP